MNKEKEKKKKPHQRRPEPEKHWLGEGIALQDSLLFDLNPYLYVLDQAIHKNIQQVAHGYEGNEKKPLALLVPPPEGVPWHVGVVAKHFDTCVLCDSEDKMLDAVAERFNVSIFAGAEPLSLAAAADLILWTESEWDRSSEFADALECTASLLGEDGRAVFVPPAETNGSETSVIWRSEEPSSLAAIFEDSLFSIFRKSGHLIAPLQSIAQAKNFGASEFAKRHREFFGRYAYDLCLARIHEQDFQELLSSNKSAVLVTVEGVVG